MDKADKLDIHVIDPLSDRRWGRLVDCHPQASVFHHASWLKALSRTYGYKPLVLTSSPAREQLTDGIVLCRVSSWLTGTRLVSLPFSDHCEPLFGSTDRSLEFMNRLRSDCDFQQWKYVELRPASGFCGQEQGFQSSKSFWLHEINLGPSLEELFRRLHKSCIQRKIRRAERERLSYESGRSRQLLDEFYRLLLITRRRHRLLPQPRSWFKNLVECMGNRLEIRVARKDDSPVAAMLTLRHGSSVVYKYGCSNAKAHNAGGVPFLFWKLIEESKMAGINRVDLGRTDCNKEGLIAFKDRLGATRKMITYYRYRNPMTTKATPNSLMQSIGQVLSLLPDAALSTAGGMLYGHLG